MSLLLCRREFVKHPFYIEILGIYIYSSQELCYVICNHPLLVMDGFVDKALFGFVKNELGMGAVAGRMEKLSETGSRPEEVLYLFLAECDYCTEKDIHKFRQTAAAYRSLPPSRYEKEAADYLFGKKQYGRAAARYEKLVSEAEEKKEEAVFVGTLYECLGAAYAQMFQFHCAYRAYDRAYGLSHSRDVLKRIFFLSVIAPELDAADTYKGLFKPEFTAAWEEELRQARTNGEQVEAVRTLRGLMKKNPDGRMEGAARLVGRWKKEYRMMV